MVKKNKINNESVPIRFSTVITCKYYINARHTSCFSIVAVRER